MTVMGMYDSRAKEVPMRPTRSRRPLAGLLTVFLIAVLTVPMAGAQTKRPVPYDAYDGWRSIEDAKLSRDGTWLVYALDPEEGDGELVARNLKTGAEFRHPRGKSPVITADGAFVVFTIAPPHADVARAKKAKKKPEDQPKNGMGIMSLASGQVFTADRVKSFQVPDESSREVAYLLEEETKEKKETKENETEESKKEKKEKKKDPGTDLIVRDLSSGTSSTIPGVVEYVWSKDGA
jgi:hypothetical protein